MPPYFLAWVATSLGDKDEAIRLLETSYRQRAGLLVTVRADPFFDSLHSDPRFQNLLRRMNFPDSSARAIP